jgi:Asp-tRNA(Asn)/Glu-tRNA(Gln) amidotransferase A subunit family amidase
VLATHQAAGQKADHRKQQGTEDGTNLDGPFAGLPFLMKDLGPTMKERLQEMGSLIMRGNRATADTFLTAKMRAAGLNLIGRTTTPEFGVCSSAENPAVSCGQKIGTVDEPVGRSASASLPGA